MNERLGKHLKVGEAFISSSKKMVKKSSYSTHYRLYKIGEKDFFTKGKRRYFCEVRALVETRTGIYVTSKDTEWTNRFKSNAWRGPRWFQFSYLVVILEN